MTVRLSLLTRFFSFALRLFIGGLFVYAGVIKIFNPTQFAGDVANYRLLPQVLVNFVAITLPWVETLAGILMVMGICLPGSTLVITGLMGIFLIAIGQALARGLDIRCGCFGTIEAGRIDALTLARDVALFIAAAWLYWRASAAKSSRGRKKNASADRGC